MFRLYSAIVIIILCGCISVVYSQQISFNQNIRGYETGLTLSMGLYKSYLNSYICLQKLSNTPIFSPQREKSLYQWLVLRSLIPRYLVVQGTAYPTAMTSSYLETYHSKEFDTLELNGWNWLRSIGGGAEEPHAFSVLLGNFAFLGYREQTADGHSRLRQSGSGMAGFLVSAGPWHILDNIRIDDRWWQAELIMTGLLNEKRARKIQWNFRCGVKFHQNPFVQDVVLISLFRDHTDWQVRHWSFSKNTVFTYVAHFPVRRDWRKGRLFVRQLLTVGKKYPFTLLGRHVAARLSGGVLAEVVRKYDHEAREFELHNRTQLIWLIQPGIEF